MHYLTHFLGGVLFVLVFKLSWSSSLVFLLSTMLIDVDHLLEVLASSEFKKSHVYNMFSFRKLNYIVPQKKLHLLHTFEVLLILFIFGNFFPIVKWVFFGFVFHMALDAVGNVVNRNFGKAGAKDWIKHWFLVYYIIKLYGKKI
ncbi:MAG: hypothetical protein ACOCQX_04975 [Candidatus Nanoarchaeia archaeon]